MGKVNDWCGLSLCSVTMIIYPNCPLCVNNRGNLQRERHEVFARCSCVYLAQHLHVIFLFNALELWRQFFFLFTMLPNHASLTNFILQINFKNEFLEMVRKRKYFYDGWWIVRPETNHLGRHTCAICITRSCVTSSMPIFQI